MPKAFSFALHATDGRARTGVISTPRGEIRTPAFMPVGTAATVQAMAARLPVVATAVGEESGTIEEVYEPFLIQEGFLQRTPRGREATAKAYEHLGKKRPGPAGTLFEE